ncbi:Crp/Fnr family transcriptional regulator [Azohydromonas lata]|uniref:Crp/Fnr family transcriptional regulator n=1 Tax=Azohydromonas lata TaxID=45677 RepID=UPI00082CA849|nr:Crp/Fnr family transcriptional regulator [Azohydromonas lata]
MNPSDFVQFLQSPAGTAFLGEFTPRRFARGQMVSMPGGAVNSVFIVRSGRLRIYLADEQRELTLAFLEPGTLFTTHTPTFVMAVEPTELSLIETRHFTACLARAPAAVGAIMRTLGTLLGSTIAIVENLAFRDARQRLAHFLLDSARRRGSVAADQGGGWVVPLRMSLTDIALLLGSRRQTVSAVLGEMQRDGLVRRQGRQQLFIPDLARLEAWLREGAARDAAREARETSAARQTAVARAP